LSASLQLAQTSPLLRPERGVPRSPCRTPRWITGGRSGVDDEQVCRFPRFLLSSRPLLIAYGLSRLNRLCGSGFQTIINAAQEIKLGEADVVLTGGTENMSLSPCTFLPFSALSSTVTHQFIADTLSGASRFGTKYGIDLKLEDSLAQSLTDRVPNPTCALLLLSLICTTY
jgi:hypothetical protein